MRNRLTLLAVGIGVVVAVQSGSAAVKVRTDFSPTFDFSKVQTWTWNPKGAGDVLMARTPDDDPQAMKAMADPEIRAAVAAEMPRRKLTLATDAPDVTVTYYLLLSMGSSAQTLGQFLPSTTQWALPPFGASTTSLEVMQRGSLVLDLSAKGEVVWRGVAEAQIQMGFDPKKRTALIHEAVRKLLERFPPKK